MDKDLLQKYYYPSCKECNGLLIIKINPLNFSIDYNCESDGIFNIHGEKGIFFKTFERFYLKEIEVYKCSKCELNLENSDFCKCQECQSVYCSKCCFEDIIINNHKKIIYEKNENKCIKHNWNYNGYCISCKSNICLYCIKENNIHLFHSTKNFSELMPSKETIENLKKRIEEKIKYTDFLIQKIDLWKREIIRKTEELKQNLRDEISLLGKIIFNYNYSFSNYTYFELFNIIKFSR